MEDVFLIFCLFFSIFLSFFDIFEIKFKIVRFIHNILIKLMYNKVYCYALTNFLQRSDMKSGYKAIKALALVLVALMLTTTLSACAGRPLAQTKLARTEVGRVGDHTVLYEELYFLATNYKKSYEDSYKDDPEGLRKAIWDDINENITENYAILELCKTAGLEYDEKKLRGDISDSIALDIEASFGGSRKEYFDSQVEFGLTDHYVRFITGVSLLYSEYAAMANNGELIPATDAERVKYVQDNFAHTWHIAVFVDAGEHRENQLFKIKEAEKLLESGTSMYELIGSEYNEDVTPEYLADTYGYYFPRGIMDEKYEDAAFDMKVGDHKIVESYAENPYGQRVECFYLIEKLSTTTDAAKVEIEKNIATLSQMMSDAAINQKKEDIKKSLTFEPNDFAKSLDVLALEPVENGADYQVILAVVLAAVLCVALAVTAVIVRRARMRKFQNSIVRK